MFNPAAFEALPRGRSIDDLGPEALTIVQRGLAACFHDAGPADGLIGRRTRSGYADLMDELGLEPDAPLGDAACSRMGEASAALGDLMGRQAGDAAAVRQAIAEACGLAGLSRNEQLAYVLATVEHETAGTFRPVREAYYLSGSDESREDWRRRNLRYYPYYGRGYAQLTWLRHYRTYGSILDIDLVEEPDLALRHDVALFALVHGMKLGGFTGRSLERYVNARQTDFYNARRVINGVDKASHVASLAQARLDALNGG